jgi:hypothetical protein
MKDRVAIPDRRLSGAAGRSLRIQRPNNRRKRRKKAR